MKENLDEKIKYEAIRFLKRKDTMALASISPDLEPQIAVVYFFCDDDFNLFFLTSEKSKKTENLRTNGKVSFIIGFGPEIITVQGGGSAKELKAQEAKVFIDLIKKIAIQSANQWPILQLAKEGYCTFKITPKWLSYLNMEKERFPEIANNEFYKII